MSNDDLPMLPDPDLTDPPIYMLVDDETGTGLASSERLSVVLRAQLELGVRSSTTIITL